MLSKIEDYPFLIDTANIRKKFYPCQPRVNRFHFFAQLCKFIINRNSLKILFNKLIFNILK